jgi:hypothetical protein
VFVRELARLKGKRRTENFLVLALVLVKLSPPKEGNFAAAFWRIFKSKTGLSSNLRTLCLFSLSIFCLQSLFRTLEANL